MPNLLIFGNSGAGKSTLAKHLVNKHQLAHLDLDTIAWQPTSPPQRHTIFQSNKLISEFLKKNSSWVIEGCYTDLLELITPFADKIIFLNLSPELCIENAKKRAWEPHKYESKAAQDANLSMLIDWISQYHCRSDTFSWQAHQTLFDNFSGQKTMYTSNITADQYSTDNIA